MLERRLVRERTELTVQAVVSELVDRWDRAMEEGRPTPTDREVIDAIIDAGLYLSTLTRAIAYLEKCTTEKTLPDRHRLAKILVPPARPPGTF
ncbi:MAG: hypothetical protein IH956_02720 [Chloroflexi bacterium]|nr:hypothetical protein [Chloroflexota bacterium]